MRFRSVHSPHGVLPPCAVPGCFPVGIILCYTFPFVSPLSLCGPLASVALFPTPPDSSSRACHSTVSFMLLRRSPPQGTCASKSLSPLSRPLPKPCAPLGCSCTLLSLCLSPCHFNAASSNLILSYGKGPSRHVLSQNSVSPPY